MARGVGREVGRNRVMPMSALIKWSDGLKQVGQMFPASIGSKDWPEIVRLANSGKTASAKELARKREVDPAVRRRNVIARRMRLERVELFKRISSAERTLRSMLDNYTGKIISSLNNKGSDMRRASAMSQVIHTQSMDLRASIRIWLNAALRDTAKMGFRHVGDALLPIFQHNRRAMEQTLLTERALYEGKLVFGLNPTFAGTTAAGVVLSSKKWTNAASQIIKNITKRNLKGLNPSERVWDLTMRAEQDLKRIVTSGLANGQNPAVIARKIKKYVSPAVADASELGISIGPGVYRSPYANAMRLARTEMSKTYTQAQASFATDKAWVSGVDITLSSAHGETDECDDLAAGGPYTADEARQLIPAHPHCLCYLTPIIDPKYLGEDVPSDAPQEEE